MIPSRPGAAVPRMVWHVALCARLCESLHRREVWTPLALGNDRQRRHVMAVSGYSGINAPISGFHEPRIYVTVEYGKVGIGQ
ncbi:hypothetical protein BJV74DRAFT_538321 [Russula compacta]|nr:hypothetical protein BJV74DRAFT_538321 [Russula compacta]